MGLKTSGETMHSLNNASRRCAHVSAIFSPPGFVLPKWGVGKEAMVFTTCYVMQRGAKAGHRVGLHSHQKTLVYGHQRQACTIKPRLVNIGGVIRSWPVRPTT